MNSVTPPERDRPGDRLLNIGVVAERTGLAVSAIRFYEEHGLVSAERSEAGHRRFPRSAIRRLSFIRICQQLGYSLEEIKTQLDRLPDQRTPTERDWTTLAGGFRADIEQRIARLTELQAKLDGCIGCGCLSLDKCRLYNPEDEARHRGSGPRYLLGDKPDST